MCDRPAIRSEFLMVPSIESIDVFKLQSGGLPVFVFPLRESWMIFVMAVDVSTYK